MAIHNVFSPIGLPSLLILYNYFVDNWIFDPLGRTSKYKSNKNQLGTF